MKTPDVNVLLHAVNRDSPQHKAARSWLESAYSTGAAVGLSWMAMLGFLRIATRSGILQKPLPVDAALSMLDAWLSHSSARVLHPTTAHAAVLRRLLLEVGAGGNFVPDAHLAALAIEHNAEFATFDRDFLRFTGLRCELLS